VFRKQMAAEVEEAIGVVAYNANYAGRQLQEMAEKWLERLD